MLVIRRIQDKAFQKELCELCGVEYNERYFAYMAVDGHPTDEGVVIDSYIGILQFTMDMGGGYINSLRCARGVDDDEALFIMTRAAMEYMSEIELPYVYIDEDAADMTLIHAMKFRRDEHGEFAIDLDEFYGSPCEYEPK